MWRTATGGKRMAGSGYTHDAQCIVYAGPDEDYRERAIMTSMREGLMMLRVRPQPIF